ncbi:MULTISPECIES: hypothetical protein [unclassified Lentimicrobium]|uniref:hypothetical protein n=1 Tax=unclassified Lentimicrobium TaxID=2677434 RepID=UPI00155261C5|nr:MULTISPECIES: hypothetical protein [unclassified Lentimicrobium]NPD45331.1 hypothetical protein [Lentimicrobium sp. S6]NPD84370.1 hypothetical protein [Lentimicrobium sp. L6]
MNSFIVIIAVIFVIAIGFRKIINLFLHKLIFGEYSRKYVLKFKQYTRKKPHPYCFKDDFYYHILSIHKAVDSPIQYQSEKVFDFDDLSFGTHLKETLKERGKPDCFTVSEEKEVDFGVMGYKSRLFHSNEKTLLYHCGNEYFMGEYVFSSINEETAELVVGMLKEKFHQDIEYNKNFTITDKAGNYVYFTDTGFYLSIKFFNKDFLTIKKILEVTTANTENGLTPLNGIGRISCAD